MRANRATPLLVGVALLSAACGSGESTGEQAGEEEAWVPTETVTIIVASEAGGGTDAMAREIAAGLQTVRDDLTIQVENRPGGSNSVGYTYGFQQESDPHQLIAVDPNVMNLSLLQETAFDWREFTHIGQVSSYSAVAVAQAGRFEDLEDLVATAENETLTVGLGGLSGPLAIATQLMETEAGVEFEKVVFNSGAEITTAVVAGNVDFGMPAPGNVVGFIGTGELDALATFTEERLEADLADVPTAVEAGVDVSASGFRGLFAPPGITDAQRQYWIDAFEEWTETPAFEEYNESVFTLAQPRVGDEFTQYLEELEPQIEPAVKAIAEDQ